MFKNEKKNEITSRAYTTTKRRCIWRIISARDITGQDLCEQKCKGYAKECFGFDMNIYHMVNVKIPKYINYLVGSEFALLILKAKWDNIEVELRKIIQSLIKL